jgi:Sigma-70, region 4
MVAEFRKTMSRLDELPPDQRAALSLLLRQRKSYAEVALLLGIAERAVHDRAHAALAVLAPGQARELAPERRQEVADYLLGQASVAERLRTRTYLAESEPARAWAQAITGELAPLAGSELPEIPQPAPPCAPARPAPRPQPNGQSAATRPIPVSEVAASMSTSPPSAQPSSRLGGALLLAAIVVAIVVAVILITTSGGSSHKHIASTKSSTSTTAATKTGPTVSPQIPLHSPSATSRSVGVVVVLSEKAKRAFYIEAQHLPATRGFFYAIWLYNSHRSAEALSRAPAVGSSHKLAGGAALPANASQFREVLLTRETSGHPTHPGHTVLRGAFSLAG